MKFEIGDKVKIVPIEMIYDFDCLAKSVQEVIRECQDRVLTVTDYNGNRCSFDEVDLIAKEEVLTLVSRVEPPTKEEFELLL